jgi:hypothetical protein
MKVVFKLSIVLQTIIHDDLIPLKKLYANLLTLDLNWSAMFVRQMRPYRTSKNKLAHQMPTCG